MSKIKDLQSKLGLTADGVLGKQSFAKLKEVWGLTDEQLAHVLGQAEHESGNFKSERENLNYSADGLRKIFGKYFKTDLEAKSYERKPEAIASKVYANRMGNGNEASKEGFKYRGAGSLQLTGKSNFKDFSDYVKEDCVANPELVSTKYYFESAVFFFKKNGILPLATKLDDNSITKVTKKVNGGTIGLAQRIQLTKSWYKKIKSLT
jgi:putative chitinase